MSVPVLSREHPGNSSNNIILRCHDNSTENDSIPPFSLSISPLSWLELLEMISVFTESQQYFENVSLKL